MINQHRSKMRIRMHKTRLASSLLAAATLLSAACSSPKAPGVWVTQDTGTSDSFYRVNFVDENVGWLNGQSGREPSEDNDNANKKAKPKKPGEKVEDPLKANQGFEILQTTDGGQTWRQIPDQFKNKIRSVWFADPQHGWEHPGHDRWRRDLVDSTQGRQGQAQAPRQSARARA